MALNFPLAGQKVSGNVSEIPKHDNATYSTSGTLTGWDNPPPPKIFKKN